MATSERKNENNRRYYANNRERILSKSRSEYKQNPEPKREATLKYARENPEKVNESNRKFRIKNPTKSTQYHRKWRYGISSEMFEGMLIEQCFCCKLCGKPFENTHNLKPVIDHNHTTGNNRALLHNACNHRLGFIEDEEFLALAITYLDKYKEEKHE